MAGPHDLLWHDCRRGRHRYSEEYLTEVGDEGFKKLAIEVDPIG
jgi:hypothetical protein